MATETVRQRSPVTTCFFDQNNMSTPKVPLATSSKNGKLDRKLYVYDGMRLSVGVVLSETLFQTPEFLATSEPCLNVSLHIDGFKVAQRCVLSRDLGNGIAICQFKTGNFVGYANEEGVPLTWFGLSNLEFRHATAVLYTDHAPPLIGDDRQASLLGTIRIDVALCRHHQGDYNSDEHNTWRVGGQICQDMVPDPTNLFVLNTTLATRAGSPVRLACPMVSDDAVVFTTGWKLVSESQRVPNNQAPATGPSAAGPISGRDPAQARGQVDEQRAGIATQPAVQSGRAAAVFQTQNYLNQTTNAGNSRDAPQMPRARHVPHPQMPNVNRMSADRDEQSVGQPRASQEPDLRPQDAPRRRVRWADQDVDFQRQYNGMLLQMDKDDQIALADIVSTFDRQHNAMKLMYEAAVHKRKAIRALIHKRECSADFFADMHGLQRRPKRARLDDSDEDGAEMHRPFERRSRSRGSLEHSGGTHRPIGDNDRNAGRSKRPSNADSTNGQNEKSEEDGEDEEENGLGTNGVQRNGQAEQEVRPAEPGNEGEPEATQAPTSQSSGPRTSTRDRRQPQRLGTEEPSEIGKPRKAPKRPKAKRGGRKS